MSEAEAAHYMRQICEGVRHMHEQNIIHLDLKPENVMCQTRTGTDVKVITFSDSRAKVTWENHNFEGLNESNS